MDGYAFLGRKEVELLAEWVYDADACGGTDPATDACAYGQESSNFYRGQLAHARAYQDGILAAEKNRVYKGLNGRLSGVRHRVDWTGLGSADTFVTRLRYENHGLQSHWIAPYPPGMDSPREYLYRYRRGLLVGVDFIGPNGQEPLVGTQHAPGVEYNPAGGFQMLRFGNDATTQVARNVLYRPSEIRALDPWGTASWDSGPYAFDGAGNITAIGAQTFVYDQAMRLTRAEVLPQATDPSESLPYVRTCTFDIYGNLTSRQRSHNGETPPAGMVFTHTHAGNRIQGPDFAIRGESDDAEACSGAAGVAVDPAVTPQSPNQARILSVARWGDDLHVCWSLLEENGKTVKLDFERADGGGTVLLTPAGVQPGVHTCTLPDQTLSSSCGSIYATQEDPSGETGPRHRHLRARLRAIRDLQREASFV